MNTVKYTIVRTVFKCLIMSLTALHKCCIVNMLEGFFYDEECSSKAVLCSQHAKNKQAVVVLSMET